MAIAEHALAQLGAAGLELEPVAALPEPPRMPNLGEAFTRPYRDAAAIAADPAYGRIVCFCERVTEGELRDACRSVIPPAPSTGCVGAPARSTAAVRASSAAPRCKASWASRDEPRVDVVIVGAGPAGLTAACRARRRRRTERRCAGTRIAGRRYPAAQRPPRLRNPRPEDVPQRPAYARRLVVRALAAGAQIRTDTMVTGWAGDRALELTAPGGRDRIEAAAIVLATGARANGPGRPG